MLGSVALDVLIGLSAIFLIFSLVGSAIVEAIATTFRWRADNLQRAINNLLSISSMDKDANPDERFRDATSFFNHPVIDALSAGDPMITSTLGKLSPLRWLSSLLLCNDRPAYIAPETFADVLIDLVVDHSVPLAQRRSFWAIRNTIQSLRDDINPTPPKNPQDPFIDLSKNTELRQTLSMLVDKTVANIPDATPNVETQRYAFFHQELQTWYSNTMDRAAGWYKRRVQAWLFVIGLLLAASINADSISFTHYLFISPEARANAVAAATQLASTTRPTDVTNPAPHDLHTVTAEAKSDTRTLTNIGIPIGWTHLDPLYPPPGEKWAKRQYLMKIAGLLLTAFALCLGAPFWFDMLNKLVNLRSSRPPAADVASSTAASPSTSPQNSLVPPARSSPLLPTPPMPPPPTLHPNYWTLPQRKRDLQNANLDQSTYSLGKAALMARASLLAYSNFPTIQQIVPTWLNIAPADMNTRFLTFDNLGTQAFLALTSVGPANVAILSFRGTEPKQLNDILADARVSLIDCTAPTRGKMHCGFAAAFKAVLTELPPAKNLETALKGIPSNTRLFLTGHSLGAALATVCASWCFANKICPELELYTFGSPRVGDPDFCADMNQLLAVPKQPSKKPALVPPAANDPSYVLARAFRFINEEDVVTRVAPRAMDYDHVGVPLYLDANGNVDLNFAEWLRFLNTVINAADNFRTEAADFIKHHSMELYVRKLDNLAGN